MPWSTASRGCLADPPEVQRKRLVRLARQALERALFLDDAPAAVFVLEEEAHDRDPAVTLAEGVLKAKARALRPPRRAAAEAAPRPLPLGPPAVDDAPRHRPPARRHPGRGRHPPRRRPGRRAEPPRTTAEAAREALRLTREAAVAAGLTELRHGFWSRPGSMELVEVEPPPAEGGPRQAQAP